MKIYILIDEFTDIDDKVARMLSSAVMRQFSNCEACKYHVVGLLVALYSRLLELRREKPDSTFLELQCEIESISFVPMTITDGRSLLSSMITDEMPLILFLDDLVISDYERLGQTNRFSFLRSLCQCLQVVVVFLGNDAKSINITGTRGGCGGTSSTDLPEWTVGFFQTPSFDSEQLKKRCDELIDGRFSRFPQLKEIVHFVRAVTPSENPWLIDLSLEHLERIDLPNMPKDIDPIRVLKGMFRHCMNRFIHRKRASGNCGEFLLSFPRAQIRYLCFYFWQNVVMSSENSTVCRGWNQGEEDCIDSHFAYLFGYPEEQNSPYFVLSVHSGKPVYTRDTQVIYKALRVFSSFNVAPITGMTLFGLSTDHEAFVGQTAFSALAVSRFPENFIPISRTGLSLEILFNCCCMVASRAGGPEGCTVTKFLSAFIHQVSDTNTPISLVRQEGSDPFPWDSAGNRRIPMLAPMPLCSWNRHLVDLFGKLFPTTCLGIYRSSHGTELCDAVAYYDDQNEKFEHELEDEEMNTALTQMGLGPVPQKFRRPNRGSIVSLQNYPRNIAFAVECKQLQDGLALSDVKAIVLEKFSDQEYQSCELFFLFTTKLAPKLLSGFAKLDMFAFWYLKRENEGHFALLRVQSNTATRHVILLSLETIWGEDYKVNVKILSTQHHQNK